MAGGFQAIGEARAMASLVGLAGRFKLGVADAANIVGQMLVTTTKQGMASAGGGRVYPNLKRQSSAPGGYPAIQSGQLVGTVNYKVSGSEKLEFGGGPATNRGFDYAVGQHEGTSKMAPRPFLHLTVEAKRGEVEHVLGHVVWQKIIGVG